MRCTCYMTNHLYLRIWDELCFRSFSFLMSTVGWSKILFSVFSIWWIPQQGLRHLIHIDEWFPLLCSALQCVLFGFRVQVHLTFHYVMLMDCTFTETTEHTEYSTMFYESLFCQYKLSDGSLGEKNNDNDEYVALQSCSLGIEMIPKVYLSLFSGFKKTISPLYFTLSPCTWGQFSCSLLL